MQKTPSQSKKKVNQKEKSQKGRAPRKVKTQEEKAAQIAKMETKIAKLKGQKQTTLNLIPKENVVHVERIQEEMFDQKQVAQGQKQFKKIQNFTQKIQARYADQIGSQPISQDEEPNSQDIVFIDNQDYDGVRKRKRIRKMGQSSFERKKREIQNFLRTNPPFGDVVIQLQQCMRIKRALKNVTLNQTQAEDIKKIIYRLYQFELLQKTMQYRTTRNSLFNYIEEIKQELAYKEELALKTPQKMQEQREVPPSTNRKVNKEQSILPQSSIPPPPPSNPPPQSSNPPPQPPAPQPQSIDLKIEAMKLMWKTMGITDENVIQGMIKVMKGEKIQQKKKEQPKEDLSKIQYCEQCASKQVKKQSQWGHQKLVKVVRKFQKSQYQVEATKICSSCKNNVIACWVARDKFIQSAVNKGFFTKQQAKLLKEKIADLEKCQLLPNFQQATVQFIVVKSQSKQSSSHLWQITVPKGNLSQNYKYATKRYSSNGYHRIHCTMKGKVFGQYDPQANVGYYSGQKLKAAMKEQVPRFIFSYLESAKNQNGLLDYFLSLMFWITNRKNWGQAPKIPTFRQCYPDAKVEAIKKPPTSAGGWQSYFI